MRSWHIRVPSKALEGLEEKFCDSMPRKAVGCLQIPAGFKGLSLTCWSNFKSLSLLADFFFLQVSPSLSPPVSFYLYALHFYLFVSSLSIFLSSFSTFTPAWSFTDIFTSSLCFFLALFFQFPFCHAFSLSFLTLLLKSFSSLLCELPLHQVPWSNDLNCFLMKNKHYVEWAFIHGFYCRSP